MFDALRRSTSFIAFQVGIALLTGLALASTAVADLPSSVASRVKKIESCLTAAEEALDLDRLPTAQRKLKDAQTPLKEIEDRYTGKFDETDAVYVAMLEHYAAVTARVKAAEEAKEKGDAAEGAAAAAHEALCREWVLKLQPFVTHSSDSCLLIGASLNREPPERQEQCKAAYRRAQALFAEYEKVKFEREKTQDLLNVESSLKSALSIYGEMESRDLQEASCREWVDRLGAYADAGRNSRRYLAVGVTVDPQEIAERTELFEEAKAVFAIYRKAEFPHGKSFELQTLEEALAEKLEEFPEALKQSQAMLSADAGGRLDQLLKHLESDNVWKSDESVKPPVLMERTIEPLRKAVADYASTVEESDARLRELRAKLAKLDARNAELHEVCAMRTFQRGDAYSGADLATLKEKAKAVAAEAHPGAKLHEVTVPSADWAVEEVIEFTDTSRTALRHRVTRSVRAQVSLVTEGGEVLLQEVYLGQDQQPGGGWGTLKGHTTWADAMARENLGNLVAKK